MARTVSRRRAIAIFAAAAGLPLLRTARAADPATVWTGQALGAPATLILNHDDPVEAARLVELVVAEVSRLETVFSLSRDDSALAELNRVGAVTAPSPDLVALLESSQSFWELTNGAFDPSVQPLWSLFYRHFSAPDADPSGPTRAAVDLTLGRVGFDSVKFSRDRVVMRPRMALTLNGVAQGYITDRIVDLLRNAGVTSSLVDMGEDRAIGSRPDGTPWRIGLAESQGDDHPDQVLNIVDKAVATSSAAGFHFDAVGRFGHILDPRSGGTPAIYRRVSVVANDATTADALSTAFSLMDEANIRSIVRARRDLLVDIVGADGGHARFDSEA
ncbi:FAD:protein FMN transferase [Rhizobium hidalgonense]|uniref:FAD:protein FMN transferase n=1 Tax=Rhizobium hidalgonense TaxID=1538159 RepID=UPI002871004A|nr:FAD:protein FMN transferase [Rhizobium hidalgonense]MDR9804662.1 FAD:protein FMN transferase [Rhizobium hidalgonense]